LHIFTYLIGFTIHLHGIYIIPLTYKSAASTLVWRSQAVVSAKVHLRNTYLISIVNHLI